MTRDILYALRGLVRQPLFSAVAILTLALGIGANTAIFTVTNAVLLRPLPYPHPERLMMLWTHNPRQGYEKDVATYPNFDEWRRSSRTFERISGYVSPSFSLTELGDPVQIRGAVVTPEFFETMAMPPLLGRGFTADDGAAGAGLKAVISYGFWRSRMGGDSAATSRTITLNGARYEVIGVMPPAFAHPADAEVWTPMTPTGPYGELFTQRGAFWLTVIGRLQPGVSRSAAQSEMDAIASRLEQQSAENAGLGVRLLSLHDEIVGDVRRPLLILLGAVSFVLLIACANVTNLLLTRASVRQRELAIRAALGAGRGRLLRQLLTESLVLAITGGIAGLALAAAGVRGLQSLAPAALPRLEEVPLDWRVLAYALVATLLAGLLFGAAPALQAAGAMPADPLRGARGGGEGSAGRRTRSVLAAVQLAVAVALLIGAGLLIRTIVALNNADIGFATRNVLVMRVELPRLKYTSGARVQAFYRELTGRLATLPGVEATGAGTSLLRHGSSAGITIEGRPAVGPNEQDIPVPYDAVTPGFFQTLQIPLLRGRMLAETDTERTPPVALVNNKFVERFFPGQDAVGKRFTFNNPSAPDHVWTTIVGVVADTRREGFARPVLAEVYFPHTQASDRRMFVVARTQGDPLGLAQAAKAQVWAIDSQQPVASVRTVAETIARSEANRRFVALLLGIFAAVALALAVIGVYGVVAYATAQRTHEIGIRMALGADRRSVLRLVLASGMKLVAGGLAIGLVAAFAITQVLSGLLFGIGARDPLTFLVVTAGLGLAGLMASWLPARRAIRVEPVAALKGD